jgi:polyhydroxyalkanoate synthesis regulator phasin
LKEGPGVLKQDVSGLKEDVGVLKQDVSGLKEDVGVLKQDVKTLDLKMEVFNNKVGKKTEEIISGIGDLLDIVATQKQVDELEPRIIILEKKAGIHNN